MFRWILWVCLAWFSLFSVDFYDNKYCDYLTVNRLMNILVYFYKIWTFSKKNTYQNWWSHTMNLKQIHILIRIRTLYGETKYSILCEIVWIMKEENHISKFNIKWSWPNVDKQFTTLSATLWIFFFSFCK